jgi:hypothetical protein
VPTPWRVLGGQYLNLGCERKVDHNVGLIIASSVPSDGPRRLEVIHKLCGELIHPQDLVLPEKPRS